MLLLSVVGLFFNFNYRLVKFVQLIYQDPKNLGSYYSSANQLWNVITYVTTYFHVAPIWMADWRKLFQRPSSSALLIGTRCYNDLAAAHFRLAYVVPMTYPQRTTDWRTLFRWPSRCALLIGSGYSDDLVAMHYRLVHSVLMLGITLCVPTSWSSL